MGIPHMACPGDRVADTRQPMVTPRDHLIDTMDINLVIRVDD